jgi:putative transposase
MTSYAVYYNRRHRRSGHLFQNRYKSIVCEEYRYFLELVRYIHLNPMRSGLVESLKELERYPWCGDGVLMGRFQFPWQQREEVLRYFGDRLREARLKYRRFMAEGINQGKRPELTGRGLRNAVAEEEEIWDPRILGDGKFVKEVLKQGVGEEKFLRLTWDGLIRKVTQWANLSLEDIASGSKRPKVAKVRCILSYLAVRRMRMKTVEVAALLNVSQSTISKCLLRGEEINKKDSKVVNQILK